MKKVSVILYVVLFLAVAGLYFMHFSGNKKSVNSVTAGSAAGTPGQGIAYVNIDSVIIKFDMFHDRQNDLIS
jgi:hypothetical protein